MVPGDYDSDYKTDFAVWRPGEGNWYILKSTGGVRMQGWGFPSDTLVPADYDGDGKTDIAVWRGDEGNWYIIQSSNGAVALKHWGGSSLGDRPVPADYDGDGKTDIAVWRPAEGNWYGIRSSDGTAMLLGLGLGDEVPVMSAYVPE